MLIVDRDKKVESKYAPLLDFFGAFMKDKDAFDLVWKLRNVVEDQASTGDHTDLDKLISLLEKLK
jgi:hypothetical protein